MSTEERKAFVRRQIDELWNKGNLDAAEECFTPDFVGHDPASPDTIRGPEGFRQNVVAVRSAFPDFHVRIVDQVAEGERVVTRYATTGTHEGELASIPPTGKRVEVAGMGIDYFSGGKIVESWEYYDVLGMMQQMGVIPYIPSRHALRRSPGRLAPTTLVGIFLWRNGGPSGVCWVGREERHVCDRRY